MGVEGPLKTLALLLSPVLRLAVKIRLTTNLPAVMAGMERHEALAFVSKLYDHAKAGHRDRGGTGLRGTPVVVQRVDSDAQR